MTMADPTAEEDEDLVEQLTQVVFDANADPWPHPQTIPAARYARAVRDFLASAGRLVPPGSETEEQIGSRVWHVDHPELARVDWTGRALAEERVRIHAEVLAADPRWRGRAEIVTRRQITTPWSPSVPDTKEET